MTRIALGPAAPVSGAPGSPPVDERLLAGELPVRPEDLPFLAGRLGLSTDARVPALEARLRRSASDLPLAPGFRRRLAGADRIEGWTRAADRWLLRYELPVAVFLERASKEHWDEALERVLAPNDLVARLDGNVLEIGRPRDLKDLVETLREIAAHGRASVEVPEGVMGKVTFKLVAVPWDQAFDLVVRTNGLRWTRTGDVIHVQVGQRGASR